MHYALCTVHGSEFFTWAVTHQPGKSSTLTRNSITKIGNSINSHNTTDTEKKMFNAGNPVLGILKDKTPPSKRLISGHLIYSNQDGLQIIFSGDVVQELSEDQLAYVQQEFINQASKLQSEALEQGLVPPTNIEIELL